ncbi:porin [Roseateles sp.]|uniref:porin n=1 Tax=Roseateles sp. TaxID=1971397 RepID=UPI0025E35B8B|nr:porin [Roseateles sp.]MBV8034404.1 porin [Roseateles sp.]
MKPHRSSIASDTWRRPRIQPALRLIGALGTLAWAGSAAAAVQLYGALDGFIQYSNNAGQASTRLLSGGASTSRWGITGDEDLGGGLHADFRLESGFNLMSGSPQNASSMYNREANVSIGSHEWGTVKLGKQYPALPPEWTDPFLSVGQLSPFASSALATRDLGNGATAVQARVNGAISYQTPDFGGLNTTFLYAPRNAADAGPAIGNTGFVTSYTRGELVVSGSYNAVWAPTSQVPGGPQDSPRTDVVMASALYTMGATLGSLSYTLLRPTTPGSHTAQTLSLGAVWQQGPHVIRTGAAFRNVSGQSNHAIGALLGYDYQFSKLTGLYARIGGFKNSGLSALSFGSDPIAAAGVSPIVFALGFRQKF